MSAPTPCPSCAGPSQPDHPAGPLGGWHHAPTCDLLAHEDGRAVADAERLGGFRSFTRDATETERTLLAALGYTWPTTETLQTAVVAVTASVLMRVWTAAKPPADQVTAP